VRGTIIARTLKDGSRRYDAVWPVGEKRMWKTFARQKDAERFLTTVVKQTQDGVYYDIVPTPMASVFDKWVIHSLEVRVKQQLLKSSTAKSYRSILKEHLRPAFGDIRSDRLRAGVLAEWARARADDIVAGTMAPKTFNNAVNLLHVILKWARHPAQGFLAHDPMVDLSRLPKRRMERRFLEPEQITALLEAANDVRDSTILALAVYSGLRRGELFGLQWHDVDWDGRIAVNRSLYQGDVSTPKTPHSIRRVDVPPSVLATLAIYRAFYPPLPGGFIFRPETGQWLDSDNWFRKSFVPVAVMAKLRPATASEDRDDEQLVGLHTLRHTYASLLINQGESLKYVSAQMGHASITITADLYGHLFKATSAAAMRKLEAQIGATGAKVVSIATGTRR